MDERIALCFELPVIEEGDSLPEWLPALPALDSDGVIRGRDGRNWTCSDLFAIQDYHARQGISIPVDVNHSTDIRAPRGEEAPAFAQIDHFAVEDGRVRAHVEYWTPRGEGALRNRDYRYLSPVILFDKAKADKGLNTLGDIFGISSLSLVNLPNFPLKAMNRAMVALNATWTRAYINDLPDSAFLYIEKGGKKDEGGKTVPRTLRHFPYKDSDGSIDLPHLRNAIARIPQAKINGLDKEALQTKARRILERAQRRNTMDLEHLKALGLPENATPEQINARLEELSKAANTQDKPSDEALMVEKVSGMIEKAINTAVTAAIAPFVKKDAESFEASVEKALNQYTKDGKIAPTEVALNFYKNQCKTEDGFKATCAYLDQAPVIVKIKNTINGSPKAPGAKTPAKILALCGVTQEEFDKAPGYKRPEEIA